MGRHLGWLWVVGIVGLTGCGSPYIKAAHHYAAIGKPSLGVEYLLAGARAQPHDQALRAELLLAHRRQQAALRQDIERLTRNEQARRAVGRLAVARETAVHAERIGIAPKHAGQWAKRRTRVERHARDELQHMLDARLARGTSGRRELQLCRRLHALAPSNQRVASRCQRLRAGLTHYAFLEIDAPSDAITARVRSSLEAEIERQRPELLELVAREGPRTNARLELVVGAPVVHARPWRQTKRNAFHAWVKRRDDAGEPIKKKVRVEPSKDEIAAAKRKGKDAPEAKVVEKQLWDQVQGEYRHFERQQTLELPFAVTLESLRGPPRTVVVHTGVLRELSRSRYYVFKGDSRARRKRPPPADMARGQEAAPELASERELLDAAAAELGPNVARQIVEHVE